MEYSDFFFKGLILNLILLFIYFLLFIKVKKTIYRIHRNYFNISFENFEKLNYLVIGIYKVLIIVFYLVPFLILEV